MTTITLPNPIMPEFWVRPQPEIEEDLALLRREAPVSFHPEPVQPPGPMAPPQTPGTWIVTRHADILHMSKHPKIFSSAEGIVVTDQIPEAREFFSSMIAMDDPRHARLRRIVSAGFTPRMLKRLEDSVQEVASGIVDRVQERGEVDFVVDVAAALPLKIVCDLMGIGEEHYEYVFDRTNIILGASDPEYVAAQEDMAMAGLTAGAELAELMNQVGATKKPGVTDDLTTTLMSTELEGDRLTPGDLASFFILLVVAGNETTRNAISWGLKFLTDNPDQRKVWQEDFEGVAPTAVEEIVRLASPVTYMRRTATEDTVVGGQDIKAGDKLCMFYLAANRDEDVFVDPYRFDVRRSPNHHVGFGGPGPHFCLGAHLARREITVMFRELFRRLPDIEATGEPAQLQSSFIHGVKHLQAAFTPLPAV
ncbi:MAG: cytochrome P450 [Actinomycetota bacterium]|nr:cytochrome P450 [Actinomycetota bacterium]